MRDSLSLLMQGDARSIPLRSNSVHTVITSPPYWGLRKYSGNQGRIWGGDPECAHKWEQRARKEKSGGQNEWSQSRYFYGDQAAVVPEGSDATCQLCGAWYGFLGLEPTPEQHIENIVEICREVRRVLRDDGVFWLNYGSSYSGSGGPGSQWDNKRDDGRDTFEKYDNPNQAPRPGVGNLMMIPVRVALALQNDGWTLRRDLIWFKRNPMPESIAGTRWVKHRIKVKRSKHASDHDIKGGTQKMLEDASVHQGIDEDWVPEYVDCPGCEKCEPNDGLILKRGSWRHTSAHEFIFMFVKKLGYWSNQEAVREIANTEGDSRFERTDNTQIFGRDGDESRKRTGNPTAGRNPRSVLDVPTAPYRGAHYATFPPNLIAPLIRATCPRWACPVCGQGWAAVVEHSRVVASESWDGKWRQADPQASARRMSSNTRARRESGESHDHPFPSPNVLGYRPTCSHEHTQEEAVPGIVFDPFVGSGTTVAVAKQLLRRGIGLDISMEYLDQQAKIRAGLGTPSNALEDLPLFSNLLE